MLVFVLGAFNAGVQAQFQDELTQLVGQVQVTEKFQSGPDSQLPTDMPDQLLDTPDVGDKVIRYNVETEGLVYFMADYTGKLQNDGDSLKIIGLDTELDTEWGGPTTNVQEGELFEDGKYEVILDSRLADVADFSTDVGDDLTVFLDAGGINTTSVEIVGIYEQEDSGAPDFVPRSYFLYTSLDTMYDLLGDTNETENQYYTSVSLLFDAETNEETNEYAKEINDYSEDGGYTPTYVSATSLAAFAEAIQETFNILGAFTTIIGLITTIAGGMAIIVTQMMSVSSRMKEFAILKSTGWKNSHIFKNVIYESIFLGLIGAGIGLGLGTGLIVLINSEGSPLGAANALITIGGIAQVFGYALGLGIIGGIYPAWKAARVRPVTVLKGE